MMKIPNDKVRTTMLNLYSAKLTYLKFRFELVRLYEKFTQIRMNKTNVVDLFIFFIWIKL